MLSLRYNGLIGNVLLAIKRYLAVFTYRILPYLLAIAFCLLLNYAYFDHLLEVQKEKEQYLLKKYMSDISYAIIADFQNALGNNHDSPFLFFRYFHSQPGMMRDNHNIYFNGDNLYVSNTKGILVLNQSDLSKFLTNILPPYIDYQILLNGADVSQSKKNRKNIDIEKRQKIDKDTNVVIRLGVNKTHPAYISDINTLYNNVLSITAASLAVVITLLYFYLKQRRNFNDRIRQLESSLLNINEQLEGTKSGLRQIITALIQERNTEAQLKKMFIRNATAIYLDSNIPGIDMDKKSMNEISNFLFPIAFTEPANDEEIDVNKVIKDLTGYLAYDATRYDIKINKQTDTLKVQCSEAVFYQILFSLVSNLILLMPQVSDSSPLDYIKKKFTVTFQEKKIVIDFETFPLNAEQIANFADKKISVDAFFLDYKRVLESMKIHNIDYCVTAGKTGNRYELDFKKKTPKGKPHLRIVE